MYLSSLIEALTEFSKRCTIDPHTNVISARYNATVAGKQTNIEVTTDDDTSATETTDG